MNKLGVTNCQNEKVEVYRKPDQMIDKNGYFVNEAWLATDGRSKNTIWGRTAFFFADNEKFKMKVKFFDNREVFDFEEDKFKHEDKATYSIKGSIIIVTNYWKSSEIRDQIIIDILRKHELRFRESGAKIKFIPW